MYASGPKPSDGAREGSETRIYTAVKMYGAPPLPLTPQSPKQDLPASGKATPT
jgi:hypothetical protein